MISGFQQKSDLEEVIDQMIYQIKDLENKIGYPYQNLFDKIYQTCEKAGSKKFIATQPEATKEWRQAIKNLLREYLKLKFSHEEIEVENIDLNPPQEVLKFKIKSANTSFWYELTEKKQGRYSILSKEKGGQKQTLALSDKERVIFQEGVLTRIFQGSHMEKANFHFIEKQPDSFWSGWKTVMGGESHWIAFLPIFVQNLIYDLCRLYCTASTPWKEYKQIIHPLLMKASLEVLNDCEDVPQVVEICGGSGELAVSIAKQYQRVMNYYLLDNNERSLQETKKNILQMHTNENTIIPIKADVTKKNDYFKDIQKQNPIEEKSIDLIIACGALTENVLLKDEAICVAKKSYKLLKPGGKMILAGHTSCLLNREDFESLGFTVINSLVVGEQNRPFNTHVGGKTMIPRIFNKQFYVLEK